MIRLKKQGSILIRNIFFVSIILLLSLSLFRFQNSNLKNINLLLKSKNILNQIKIIKNELYFNQQYLYIGDGIYINKENLDLPKYKEFKEIFENTHTRMGDYFYLEFGKVENEINITYFSENEFLFKYILTI